MTKPFQRDFPSEILTERLLIRGPLPEDGAILNAALLETWDDLRRWMHWAQTPPSVKESEANTVRSYQLLKNGEDFHLHAFLRESGEFVLAIGLHSKDATVPVYEIDYWCRTSKQGRGYVTEAVRAITEVAFNQLMAQRVQICCEATNIRSHKVAGRAGFQLEATLHNNRREPDGTISDTLIFALWPEIRVLDTPVIL